jgi:hypothetical protein
MPFVRTVISMTMVFALFVLGDTGARVIPVPFVTKGSILLQAKQRVLLVPGDITVLLVLKPRWNVLLANMQRVVQPCAPPVPLENTVKQGLMDV